MSKLSAQITVDAPADAVWDVIGRRFDRIGDWATAIRASWALRPSMSARTATRSLAAGPDAGAPVAGRICRTGVLLVGQVTETLVAYDAANRTLTYEATGLPAFVTTARNTWTVTALSAGRTQVTLEAQFETRGLIGVLGRVAMLIQVRFAGRRLAEDLGHYVEHGTPSPRKQRQLNRARGSARAEVSRPTAPPEAPMTP
jgi:hypothetical protein